MALLARDASDGQAAALVETRRLHGGRAYVAAIIDLADRALEWYELGVQTPEDLADSPAARCGLLTNALLDREWDRVVGALRQLNPDAVIPAGAALVAGRVWLIDFARGHASWLVDAGTGKPFGLCRDEQRLRAAGRTGYANSLARGFSAPDGEATGWLDVDSLANAERLPKGTALHGLPEPGGPATLLLSGGQVILRRMAPVSLSTFATWLRDRGIERDHVRGEAPPPADPLERLERLILESHPKSSTAAAKFFDADPAMESFFLRLELWKAVTEEALRVATLADRPFFDLASDSFRVRPGSPSPLVPPAWSFSVEVVRPGVAAPFDLPGIGTCFVPCGNGTGSPLFERFGGWMEGTGTIRISQAADAGDGQTRLEGTIEGQGLRSGTDQRIIWVQVTIDRVSVTFMASLETEQPGARAGVRFRALLRDLAPATLAQLKNAAAPRRSCQYHVLRPVDPALDIHALGLVGMRILLTADAAVLPELEDDVFELAAILPDECSIDQVSTLARSTEIGERLRRLLTPEPWNPGEGAVPAEVWHAAVRELAAFVGVEEQETLPPTHREDGTAAWIEPLAHRVSALRHLCHHVRGLLSAPRTAHEEIARTVHRFVRSRR